MPKWVPEWVRPGPAQGVANRPYSGTLRDTGQCDLYV